MIPLALTLAALAQDALDPRPVLPTERTLVWTHLVTCEEKSHWGDARVRAVVLTRQDVVAGGAPGGGRIEWLDVVEGVAADLDFGDQVVTSWNRAEDPVEARRLRRFEAMAGTTWHAWLSPTGSSAWYQVMEDGQARYPSEVAGPAPPVLLAWYQGLWLGAGRGPTGELEPLGPMAAGQARTIEVDVALWGLGVVRARAELTLEGLDARRADLRYRLTPVGLPLRAAGVEVDDLQGGGEIVVDVRRRLVVEHHQDLAVHVAEGAFGYARHETVSSFLHRVRRHPPRRPREARVGEASP